MPFGNPTMDTQDSEKLHVQECGCNLQQCLSNRPGKLRRLRYRSEFPARYSQQQGKGTASNRVRPSALSVNEN